MWKLLICFVFCRACTCQEHVGRHSLLAWFTTWLERLISFPLTYVFRSGAIENDNIFGCTVYACQKVSDPFMSKGGFIDHANLLLFKPQALIWIGGGMPGYNSLLFSFHLGRLEILIGCRRKLKFQFATWSFISFAFLMLFLKSCWLLWSAPARKPLGSISVSPGGTGVRYRKKVEKSQDWIQSEIQSLFSRKSEGYSSEALLLRTALEQATKISDMNTFSVDLSWVEQLGDLTGVRCRRQMDTPYHRDQLVLWSKLADQIKEVSILPLFIQYSENSSYNGHFSLTMFDNSLTGKDIRRRN